MRIAAIGCREFTNQKLVDAVLSKYLGEITLIVSGGACGADSMAEDFAKRHNIDTLIFKPDWNKYGKSAGFIRNEDIIKNADLVIAFWDMESKGTAHSLSLAEKYGVKSIIINIKT